MLAIITILGIFLRVTFINKAEGLWNDEYVSWMVANTPFNQGFWGEVLKQCHMPLYYLYLKPFASCGDTILRLTSLVPSVISIYVMYLLGKEYSKKIGLLSASLTSFLSFLVYYAQEVRFYSLLFLFSAILLLFTIRFVKNNNKFNLVGLIVSSLLVIFTHILGIIFVFFNTLFVLYKNKIYTKKTLAIGSALVLILLPFFINVLNKIPYSQWWGKFSYTNVLFLFSDYFSPILTNNVNAPPTFFYNMQLAVWLTVPTVVAVFAMIFGIKQNKGITLVSVLYLIVLFIFAISGKLVFITKYSIEILPIMILLVSVGFSRLNKAGLILFALFISFHFASFFTPYYVTKIFRSEGHRIVGEILNTRQPKFVVYTYYASDRFGRYYKGDAIQLYISKLNRMEYVNNPTKILDYVPKGESLSIVFLDSVSFLTEDYIEKTEVNIPEMFVTFSHIKNVLTDKVFSEYSNVIEDKIGDWYIITAKK